MLRVNNSCPRQQTLFQAIDSHTYELIREDSRNDQRFLAHLNLTTAGGAGSWLHTVPSKALGTHVDPRLYKTMVQRWLRLPLYESEFNCPFCDDVVDKHGDHCLTCSCGGDRTKRHNLLRNEVFHLCNSAGLSPELERPGLLQSRPLAGSAQESGAERDPNANRRPADVYLPKWRRGAPATLDLAITSCLRADMLNKTLDDGSNPSKHMNTLSVHTRTQNLSAEKRGSTSSLSSVRLMEEPGDQLQMECGMKLPNTSQF